MRRSVITCDRCGRDIDEEQDVETVYSVRTEHALVSQLRTDADYHQPSVEADLCGMCYSHISGALGSLLRTQGAVVYLPSPGDDVKAEAIARWLYTRIVVGERQRDANWDDLVPEHREGWLREAQELVAALPHHARVQS